MTSNTFSVFAHGQAKVANNIVHAIIGAGEPRSFPGHECFIEIGDGRAGFGSGNFLAEPAPDVWLYGWF